MAVETSEFARWRDEYEAYKLQAFDLSEYQRALLATGTGTTAEWDLILARYDTLGAELERLEREYEEMFPRQQGVR